MLLRNVNIIGDEELRQIRIVGERIEEISSNAKNIKTDGNESEIIFEKAIVFPGLINSHDHLDFDLFPRLANRIYENYKEWGPDIHAQHDEVIRSILKVPKRLRAQWGVYKNLLSGFTTVVNHGEYLPLDNSLITIFQDCYSLHSVAVEKRWRLKLNNPFLKNWPLVVHVGEGTDLVACKEISQLARWNVFKRRLIAVHGVAMNEKQAKSFEAVIWCPDSNFFLLNATARVDLLKEQTKILFGTDSTLSAGWNAWEQIRLARGTKMLTDEQLFQSLTATPAAVWNLEDRGQLAEGKKADIVIAEMGHSNNSMDNFFELNPDNILLVVRSGEIVFFDETLHSQLSSKVRASFNKIFINNVVKYVKGELIALITQIRRHKPDFKCPVEIS